MATWTSWLPSRPFEWHVRPTDANVEALRVRLLDALDDCTGFEVDRLRWRLHTAECAQELWLLRDAVFQAVSQAHCQSVAMHRINEMLPFFRQVLPARLLTRV